MSIQYQTPINTSHLDDDGWLKRGQHIVTSGLSLQTKIILKHKDIGNGVADCVYTPALTISYIKEKVFEKQKKT